MTMRSKIHRLANAEAFLEQDRKVAFRELLRRVGKHPDGESFWRVVFANAGMDGIPNLTGGIQVLPEDWKKADVVFDEISDDTWKRLQLDHKV